MEMQVRGFQVLVSFRVLVAVAAGLLVPGSWARAAGENEVYRVAGEPLKGKVTFQHGAWLAGEVRVVPSEVLLIRFSATAPPQRIPAGVFVRGGSLFSGNVITLNESSLSVNATSLGRTVELKTADFAGAFMPLPPGMAENFPALGSYARILAALESSSEGAQAAQDVEERGRLQPGRRNFVTFLNRDEVEGRVVMLRKEIALVERPQKGMLDPPPLRKVLRLIECLVEPPPAPVREEPPQGPEVAIRLLAGDLWKGHVVKLDDTSLTLVTRFAGTLNVPREALLVLFPTGAKGSGLRWISSLAPSTNTHTPLFDARVPARMNLSCGGSMPNLGGLVCDRAIGVHSRSELTYALEGKPGKKFVALVGIDASVKAVLEETAREVETLSGFLGA